MFGEILGGLTNPATAEATVLAVAAPDIRARIEAACVAEAVPLGALVASRVRHLVEHGEEDLWTDLLGAMANSPQPGAAAIARVLARAFPDPVRMRVTRTGG